MVVDEIMTRKPEFIAPNQSVADAMEKLLELGVRHLPVVKDGELVGLLSKSDLQSRFSLELTSTLLDPEHTRRQLQTPVHEVMQSDFVAIELGTDVGELMDEMLDSKAEAVPVVDGHANKLVGIISYIDVIRAARPYFG